MSGIAGVLHLDGVPADRADLDRMLERLAHRGPDGAGAWHDGPVGLGHRMLHTTPESLRERQPLVGTRGDLVLVADARIDNRAELCSLLPAPSPTPPSSCSPTSGGESAPRSTCSATSRSRSGTNVGTCCSARVITSG